MPKGRSFPLGLGMNTRLRGLGLYPSSFNISTARAFAFGVFQVSPSTPGVLAPWFSVTRLTANLLAAIEWVSRFCNLLTLPLLPSLSALAICFCRLNTFLLTWFQSVSCQFEVSVRLTSGIATSVFSWFSELSIMLSFRHSRPGARQHIQPITGWPWLFAPSYSLRSWGFLTVALPILGERVGVSTFHNDDKECLGSVYPPVDLSTLCIERGVIHPYHLPFGSSLLAT